MPLSEFLRMARDQLESGQQKPTNLSSRPDDELVELVWENGQIMMQGQSSRVPKSPPRKLRDPGLLLGNSRIGKFDAVDSVPDDIELDFDQDDEMVPWLNYPIEDDALAQLPEISSLTAQNSFPSAEKRSSCGQKVSNLYTCSSSSLSSSSKSHMLSSLQPHTSNAVGQQQPPISNSNLMNFSHFARSDKTLVKSNFSNPDAIPTVSSVLERMEIREKGSSPASGSNLVKKSAFVDRFNSTRKDVVSREPVFNAAAKNLCGENSIKNDKPVIQSNNGDSVKKESKTVEPVVASSSVGSGNSGDRVSCEQTYNSKRKRKFRDIEESECHSDDIDTESVGAKKPSLGRGGGGSKRSRAAEVHNLSERRRRDRINEKMRALQELIPNCNKADKASMLDEAIEYLKTLQLQVQIMSMGAGLCMPQMMFPGGMHPAHVPHFPPMGIGMGMGMGMPMGMGMGMGFGMDHMIDMNGRSSGYPIFPAPPISGPTNFQRIPGPTNFPVYGQPSQGLHNSVPRPPLAPSTSQPHAIPIPKSPLMCNAEASSSLNRKPDQMPATNEVIRKQVAAREIKTAADASGTTAVTSTTETDISKKPGYD